MRLLDLFPRYFYIVKRVVCPNPSLPPHILSCDLASTYSHILSKSTHNRRCLGKGVHSSCGAQILLPVLHRYSTASTSSFCGVVLVIPLIHFHFRRLLFSIWMFLLSFILSGLCFISDRFQVRKGIVSF